MNNGVKLIIKDAVPSDAKDIHSILNVAFEEYCTILGITPNAISESEVDIVTDIKTKNVLIARASNTLTVGTIRYHMMDNICYISRFGVLPNWQSSGAGNLLLKEVEQRAKQLGAAAIMLHSASKLLKQVRYYYGQGFFIHSTDHTPGYIRALFIKELGDNYKVPNTFKSN